MNRILICLLLVISQDTLQVKVSLVSVGVRVTDSRLRSISGLKAGDFSVLDDGVPQKIEFFSSEEQPITLGILLDHSSSMASNAKLDRAKEAARKLVETTRQGSEYFYIAFDERVHLASDFTTDREKVDSAIQETKLGGGTSLYDAIVQGVVLSNKARLPRQALVVISDGADQHSRYQLQQVLHLVRESEMQVYTIGYFGASEERSFATKDETIPLIDGIEIDNPRLVLNELARDSGGVAFFPKSDAELAKAVDEITNDLRTQYTLAFYPRLAETETRYHQLRVTVRGGRYAVRARPGYGTAEIPPPLAHRDTPPAYGSKIDHRNGRIFYHDDFSDVTSGWPDRRSAKYSSKGYELSGENVVAVNGPAFADFRAAVLVSLSNGSGGGLVFRQKNDSYYAIAAYPARRSLESGVLLALHVDSTGTQELNRWPLIRTASRDLKLEVRC
jgi:Ca-activated chloride channel family protein